MQSEMAAFTNTRLVPIGENGKPVRVQEYSVLIAESSRSLSVLDALFKEQEKHSAAGSVVKPQPSSKS